MDGGAQGREGSRGQARARLGTPFTLKDENVYYTRPGQHASSIL